MERQEVTHEQAGELIKKWREVNGVTQAVLSERLGISEKHMSGVETGSRSVSLNVAIRIERETGVPVEAWEEPRPEAVDSGAGDVAPVRASA